MQVGWKLNEDKYSRFTLRTSLSAYQLPACKYRKQLQVLNLKYFNDLKVRGKRKRR